MMTRSTAEVRAPQERSDALRVLVICADETRAVEIASRLRMTDPGLAPVEPAVVKEYDTRILRNEAEALMSPAVDGWWNSITPLPLAGPIVPWSPLTAEQGFLARFRRFVL